MVHLGSAASELRKCSRSGFRRRVVAPVAVLLLLASLVLQFSWCGLPQGAFAVGRCSKLLRGRVCLRATSYSDKTGLTERVRASMPENMTGEEKAKWAAEMAVKMQEEYDKLNVPEYEEAMPGIHFFLEGCQLEEYLPQVNAWIRKEKFLNLGEVLCAFHRWVTSMNFEPEVHKLVQEKIDFVVAEAHRSGQFSKNKDRETKQTFSKSTLQNPLAAPRPEEGEAVSGLILWLHELDLEDQLEPVNAWCEEMGALVLGEVVENVEDLAEALDLPQETKKRLVEEGQKILDRLEWRGIFSSQPAVRPRGDLGGSTFIRKSKKTA